MVKRICHGKEWEFYESCRPGLSLGPNQSFLFLPSQQLLNFQSCFSLFEANRCTSLDSFSKLPFGEIPLNHDRDPAAVGPLRAVLLAEIISNVTPLSFQGVKFKISQNLK